MDIEFEGSSPYLTVNAAYLSRLEAAEHVSNLWETIIVEFTNTSDKVLQFTEITDIEFYDTQNTFVAWETDLEVFGSVGEDQFGAHTEIILPGQTVLATGELYYETSWFDIQTDITSVVINAVDFGCMEDCGSTFNLSPDRLLPLSYEMSTPPTYPHHSSQGVLELTEKNFSDVAMEFRDIDAIYLNEAGIPIYHEDMKDNYEPLQAGEQRVLVDDHFRGFYGTSTNVVFIINFQSVNE